MTFARLREAQQGLDPRGWVFLVLTLDREGYFSGEKRWADVDHAFRDLGRMTTATLKRIGRLWGPEVRAERSGRSKQLRTVRYLGNRWVSVVEAHRSGWPHMNLYVWAPELAEQLRRDQAQRLEDPEIANAVALRRDAWRNKEPLQPMDRELARKATLIDGPLRELLEGCGWGRQSTAEAAEDIEAVMAYGVKLVGLHDAALGEIAKVTQAPTNAPSRFRRLRSGKGFLPPRRSDPNVTGCLLRRRRSVQGDWEILRVNPPKEEASWAPIELALRAERTLIALEEEELARNRGKLGPQPPLVTTVNGVPRRTQKQLARVLVPLFHGREDDDSLRNRQPKVSALQRQPRPPPRARAG